MSSPCNVKAERSRAWMTLTMRFNATVGVCRKNYTSDK